MEREFLWALFCNNFLAMTLFHIYLINNDVRYSHLRCLVIVIHFGNSKVGIGSFALICVEFAPPLSHSSM